MESMVRGISVMRRVADGWVNATQILKVAGLAKSNRTRIIETVVNHGVHEKVQGGCECSLGQS
jgi:regulatory protein SWI6